MDFMSDALRNGQRIRIFNVMDDYNREGLAVEVDQSLLSTRMIEEYWSKPLNGDVNRRRYVVIRDYVLSQAFFEQNPLVKHYYMPSS